MWKTIQLNLVGSYSFAKWAICYSPTNHGDLNFHGSCISSTSFRDPNSGASEPGDVLKCYLFDWHWQKTYCFSFSFFLFFFFNQRRVKDVWLKIKFQFDPQRRKVSCAASVSVATSLAASVVSSRCNGQWSATAGLWLISRPRKRNTQRKGEWTKLSRLDRHLRGFRLTKGITRDNEAASRNAPHPPLKYNSSSTGNGLVVILGALPTVNILFQPQTAKVN